MAEQEVIHSVDLHLNEEAETSAENSRYVAERRAFWAMHAELLKAYDEKYLAILDGKGGGLRPR